MRTDRMTNVRVPFRNFANSPKKAYTRQAEKRASADYSGFAPGRKLQLSL